MRAAVYVRISQDREGLEVGVERQEEACRKLASDRGWEVAEIYSDNDVSATSGKPRPAWERLLHDLENDGLGAVVAYSSSRLYRRLADLERLISLAKGGLEIATVASGRVNLQTADGIMVAEILASVDKAEAAKIGERVKAALAKKATEGGWHGGGRRPYGYRIVGGKEKDGNPARLEIEPDEAAAIREMVTLALEGASLSRITATMNGRGVTTSGGNRWRPAGIKRLLTAPFHAGKLPNGVAGDWPAIIAEKEQLALSAILVNRSAPRREGRRYVLSGLIRCGECDTGLVGSAGYYRCNDWSGGCGKTSIKVKGIDAFVLRAVRAQVARLILAAPPPDALGAPQPEPPSERDELLDEIATVQGRLDHIGEQVADGVLDDRQAKIAGDKLRARMSALEGQLRQQSEERPFPLFEPDIDDIDSWSAEKMLDVRSLVREVAPSIVVGKGHGFAPERVSIEWGTDVIGTMTPKTARKV